MSTLPRLLRTRLASAGITLDEANHLADLGHIEHLDVLATWLGDDQTELVDSYLRRLLVVRREAAHTPDLRALGQQAVSATHPDERADAWGDITADEAVAWIDAMAEVFQSPERGETGSNRPGIVLGVR